MAFATPLGALTSTDLAGRTLATPLAAGELVSRTRLVPRSPAEGLPSGTTPLRVRVVDPRMLDLVTPGQRADVYRGTTGESLSRGVLVLAVDPPSISTNPLLPASDEPGVVLAVPNETVGPLLAQPEDGLTARVHVIPAGR